MKTAYDAPSVFEQACPGGTVKVEMHWQGIYLDPGTRVADERWRFTDAAGHHHAYQHDKQHPGGHYPTLQYVPGEDAYCGRCGEAHEDYDESKYVCRGCGEEIKPGYRVSNGYEGRYPTGRYAYFKPDQEEFTAELLARANKPPADSLNATYTRSAKAYAQRGWIPITLAQAEDFLSAALTHQKGDGSKYVFRLTKEKRT